jgi:hypothetical protein
LIAKEKHKHEIESAWKDGLTVNELNSKLATDYYNKTFDHD